jgi:prepilin-type N-terminal cleavage/methylation domain-containing protein
MRMRRGVSLLEVVVATVLLAVGVTGTLASLAAAERLRRSARGHEALAAAALDRLAWFRAAACLTGDTTMVHQIEPAGDIQWSSRTVPHGRALAWRGTTTTHPPQLVEVSTRWRCD